MRLNRVLQTKLNRVSLLATVGVVAVVATVFTISCGGDGAEGAPGASCSISGSSAPYTVTCSGVEVGLLNGGPGAVGPTGPQGSKGNGCSLVPSGTLSYTVSCGGSVQGTLDGCSVVPNASNSREVIIDCGTAKISLCDDEIFDPSEKYCPLTSGAATSVGFCGPDSLIYNISKKYCGFKDSTNWRAGKVEVLDLCGSDSPNKAMGRAEADELWVLVGSAGVITDSSGTWLAEYCQVTRNPSYDPTDTDEPLERKAVASPDTCNGVPVTFNKDEWKGQYCGFASKTAAVKTVLTDACGNGDKPNEDAYADGYCAIASKTALLTSKSTAFCGPVKLGTKRPKTDSAAFKLNASTVQGVLPKDAWKGDYCGYTAANFAKTMKGFTGDSLLKDTSTAGTPIKPTLTATDSTLYLSKITGTATVKLCDSVTATTSSENQGPNDSAAYNFSHNTTTKAWTKRPVWLNQYCQVPRSGALSRPVPTPGQASSDTVALGDLSAYCIKAVDSTYRTAAATARLNENSWKGEACVFAKLADYPKVAEGPDRNGAPTIVKNTACGDGQVPNDANISNYSEVALGALASGKYVGGYFGTAGMDSSSAATFHQPFWRNQYCQYSTSTGTKRVGITLHGSANAIRTSGVLNKYCIADTASVETIDAAKKDTAYLSLLQKAGTSNFINAGTTSNQYCGFKQKDHLQKSDTAAADKFTFSRLITCTDGTKPNDADTITASRLGASKANVRNPKGSDAQDAIDSLVYWRNEFCQYDRARGTGTTKVGLELAKTDTIIRDPKVFLKYCPGDTVLVKGADEGNAAYINKFQGGTGGTLSSSVLFRGSITKLNLGNATTNAVDKTNQYCGLNSWANDTAKAKFTVATTGAAADASSNVKLFSVLTTPRCADGKAVNAVMDDDGTANNGWNNDYCQVDRNTGGLSARVGGSANYCVKDKPDGDAGEWRNASATTRLNEGSYKGQFCFADQVIGLCSGGWVGVSDAKSTDPSDVRCELP